MSQLLKAWHDGDERAWERLIPLVYDELRRQARLRLRRERMNHTLQTTALVHEAYVRLADQNLADWQNRGQFFCIASEMMRRILVDHARGRDRERRGGEVELISMDMDLQVAINSAQIDLMELDEALKRLAAIDGQQAKIVELRYFTGCSVEETAEALGISTRTVKRDWAMAKAWLKHELRPKT